MYLKTAGVVLNFLPSRLTRVSNTRLTLRVLHAATPQTHRLLLPLLPLLPLLCLPCLTAIRLCQVLFNGITVGDVASWVDSLLVAYLLNFGASSFSRVEETTHEERQLAYTFQVRRRRCCFGGLRVPHDCASS
jgi:hypothetical protein